MNMTALVATKTVIFGVAHIAGLAGAILCYLWAVGYMVPVTGTMVAWCFALYGIRMFGITGVYHRYFAHKTYKTSRPFQLCLACVGAMASQKGPLWWAAHHRSHHRYSDTENDVHSPYAYGALNSFPKLLRGFYWSHVGWMLSPHSYETDFERIQDFARYPEIRLLNQFWYIPPGMLAFGCWWFGGWGGLLVSFFLSTLLLWHGTFCINSVTHLYGKQDYETWDASKNSLFLSLVTLGEGWHNNHHRFPSSERQGIWWWQIDITHYLLKAMSWLGLVWDIQTHETLSGYKKKVCQTKKTKCS